MPFWAADNLDEVTAGPVILNSSSENIFWNLFDGTFESECEKPCRLGPYLWYHMN